MRKTTLTAAGGVTTAFLSALCCLGPVLAVAVGLSGAGFMSTFTPLRPYFLAATGLLLGLGFYLLWREGRRACEPGEACADPVVRRRMKWTLWIATVLAVVLASYPSWSAWLG